VDEAAGRVSPLGRLRVSFGRQGAYEKSIHQKRTDCRTGMKKALRAEHTPGCAAQCRNLPALARIRRSPCQNRWQSSESFWAPIGSQKSGRGVTYSQPARARMEESKVRGGGDFYDWSMLPLGPNCSSRAWAPRGGEQRPRSHPPGFELDVPEPELTLVINSRRKIVGYTIGNDMSSRDNRGRNPMYLRRQRSTTEAAAWVHVCWWRKGRWQNRREIG